ncbi:cell envelope opacity-associated protein [Escherichia coli]|uniref:Cell envelope opacity-associated protein n=1 Tax=Escherichia coli TaxID=562 RepID=A0A376RRI1_ECOLX|nr:cell envelope opacity-associated protein [Escherichia coli]
MIEEQDAEQEETMPGRFELKPTLEKVWHAPDNFRFMDPLPPMHRRGIIIAAIVLGSDFCFHLMIRPTRRW